MPLLDDFVRLFQGYNSRRDDIRAFTNPSNSSPAELSVTHLLEGSAVEIQLAILHLFFGEEAVLRFINFVRQGNNSSFYLAIRADISEELYSKGDMSLDMAELVTYLTRCSLLGTTFPHAKLAESPNSATLYEALVEHVLRRSGDLPKVGLQGVVDEFYHSWGFLTPEEVTSRFAAVTERRLEDGKKKLGQLGSSSGQDVFIRAYEHFAATFLRMNAWIKDTNLQYFNGLGYLDAYVQGLLPSVHIKVKVNDKMHDFMSRGYDTIPFDSWNFVTSMSTTFAMLVDGRCTTPSLDFENLCFRELTSTDWHGTRLKFRDKSIF
jgi:hypothetical protein